MSKDDAGPWMGWLVERVEKTRLGIPFGKVTRRGERKKGDSRGGRMTLFLQDDWGERLGFEKHR